MLWWLGIKVLGIILILAGIFLVVFFPMSPEDQNIREMGISVDVVGVIVGIVLLIIGVFLVFS
ncbi:MAG: hypothetical protein GTN38_00040 [Candidatus Aenigmarchaeota archaeon]|nr:hypothetical protein [Candidatus Aenigmarchaeota archaeon]NIP39894.1 hypothetical protein [Candidatus Aenigmarchaeota archaeon]NIQ17613.1 hypothetical protein [Candidatus Aenigmarchaeota archaeon]NIS72801.1 hypothetical protein [Candidatus Aenigmarchaeota archaeon]